MTLALFLGISYATQALNQGFETGIRLLFAAAVIVYEWRRLRPQPS